MPHLPFVAGDIVTVEAENGKFRILKVLAVDEAGLYVRLFVQQFSERPRVLNVEELSIPLFGPVNFAFTHDHFEKWHPDIVAFQKVADTDLRDYRIWLAEKGTYE